MPEWRHPKPIVIYMHLNPDVLADKIAERLKEKNADS